MTVRVKILKMNDDSVHCSVVSTHSQSVDKIPADKYYLTTHNRIRRNVQSSGERSMSLVLALQKSARSGEERRPLCSTSTSANPIFRPAELLGRYSSHSIIIKRFVEEALWSGRNRGSCLVDNTGRLVRLHFKAVQ